MKAPTREQIEQRLVTTRAIRARWNNSQGANKKYVETLDVDIWALEQALEVVSARAATTTPTSGT
jgi:hypothetical protein